MGSWTEEGLVNFHKKADKPPSEYIKINDSSQQEGFARAISIYGTSLNFGSCGRSKATLL